jgi:GGDEF domain-containing protein
MSIHAPLLTATRDDAVQGLQVALAQASDAHRLLSRAWQWFHRHAAADVLGVATLGPPEPVGYLFAEGVFETGTRNGLWEQLVGMAREVRPEPGMYPRRAADRRAWHMHGPLPTIFDSPVMLGPWAVQAGGSAAGRVMVWQAEPQPTDPEIMALMPEAAVLTTLYLRNLQWLDIDPDPEPTDLVTFEELLENEVSAARRKRVPMSLALIEYRLSEANLYDCGTPPELHDEVESVIKQIARRGDRIVSVGEACIAVVMPKTDARGALVGADRLQRALTAHLNGREPKVCVQIGIGGRDPEETQASELFARASQALAEARNAHGEAAFVHI